MEPLCTFHAILIVLRMLKIWQKAMGKIYIEIVGILECLHLEFLGYQHFRVTTF